MKNAAPNKPTHIVKGNIFGCLCGVYAYAGKCTGPKCPVVYCCGDVTESCPTNTGCCVADGAGDCYCAPIKVCQ
jgi:hypothetical protein